MASITVIGAGIIGLSAAWEMVRRGRHVRVIEARHVAAGSSGGTVGALAPHSPDGWNEKKQVQLDSLLAAPDFWAEVADVGGRDPGYARTGRVQPVLAVDLTRMHARIEGAARHWRNQARMWLTRDPDGPLIPESADGWWLMDDLTARISPRRACDALAAAIRAKGGEIVTGVEATPDDVQGPAIWATGTDGLIALNAELGRKIGQGVKGQSAALRFNAPDAPQVFADGLHLVPHADGSVGIGSTSENSFEHGRVDAKLDEVIARARAICPALNEAPLIESWAGTRPRARSRAPLIGAWPGRAGHFVLNGGFKIGFGMAPSMAGMIADLVLGGSASIPEGFRLGDPASGARGRD
ncbi:NAD(P)/FAD-dependent oxidoreductase [Paracoccus sediminicola]|uniref:NAD(P)/FAD-dependent oxidoreductase n=1 Tax=Paracoccus sediminicola TaxID=3017783 RepID=UPI0022F06B4B|nr:FAD-dependent oxidoreductase [Paracoccus sediminicola]WBU56462.1 FAD-dependent oxidoreductase [Paracoccus sediminicola]